MLAADASFNLPDYRCLERGFQLLTQVSGRAGRGTTPGQVILQTYTLELPALLLAQKHDYKSFYEQEIVSRQAFDYPPFSQIIRVVIAGDEQLVVLQALEQLAEATSTYLEDKVSVEAVTIAGPAPCLIERLRGKWRFHIILKNKAGKDAQTLITNFLRNYKMNPGLAMSYDVEALDLL